MDTKAYKSGECDERSGEVGYGGLVVVMHISDDTEDAVREAHQTYQNNWNNSGDVVDVPVNGQIAGPGDPNGFEWAHKP